MRRHERAKEIDVDAVFESIADESPPDTPFDRSPRCSDTNTPLAARVFSSSRSRSVSGYGSALGW
jgi:hypothetical protein